MCLNHCSNLQIQILEELINASLTPKNVVVRASIVRMFVQGVAPTPISRTLCISYPTLYKWQNRWMKATADLNKIETRSSKSELKKAILDVLKDGYRSGAPPKFTEDQVMKILALACKSPESEGLPISHWSCTSLAEHAKKLGIVDSISPKQINNFLKSGGIKTSQKQMLAQFTRKKSKNI